MLKYIYVDNYKSFVDFRLEFGSISLLMGVNGAGKTTLFDVLNTLKEFLSAQTALEELFSEETQTRWKKSTVQTFEIGIEHQGKLFQYELAVERETDGSTVEIQYESLSLDDQPLLRYKKNENALVYYPNSVLGPLKVENIRFSRTTLDAIPLIKETEQITWFRSRMERFLILQINPLSIDSESQSATSELGRSGNNFISWYRHIVEQDKATEQYIKHELADIFDEFHELSLTKQGEYARGLEAQFRQNGHMLKYRFNELSEGERMLTILYTLISYAKAKDYTLCIDEPGNYLALQEIQPWLAQVADICDDDELQAIIVSHHPELINYLVFRKAGIWLSRESSSSPTKAMTFPDHSASPLPVAELVARGWVDDE